MDSYLAHHGIKGQKWGVRRFRNSDGLLTEAGRKRYSDAQASVSTPGGSRTRNFKEDAKAFYGRHEKAIKIGAAVAGTALAVYGAYKLNQHINLKNLEVGQLVGASFADKFANDIGAQGMGPGNTPFKRVSAGSQSRAFARSASGYFQAQVAENIANRRGIGRIKNVINLRRIKRGKATPFDLYQYGKMATESIIKSGAFINDQYQELKRNANTSQAAYERWHYAALLQDAIDFGGQIPFEEYKQWLRDNRAG